MPELPEVEIIKNDLLLKLKNKSINNVYFNNIKLRKEIPNLNKIIDNKIIDVKRINKYIVITLDNYFLIIHLGMTGQLIISNEKSQLNHIHCYLKFNEFYLSYRDPRRFGLIDLIPNTINIKSIIYFKNFGLDPFDDGFTVNYLFTNLQKSRYNIKKFLMESKYICGIGNIYACEILFASNISPLRISNTISINEVVKLHFNIIKILKKSISLGGSTISDFIHINGVKGSMQNHYYVYSKKNEKCKVCNNMILSIKQNGRTTYYCEFCQI